MNACLFVLAILASRLTPDCLTGAADVPVLLHEPCATRQEETASAGRGLFSNVIVRGIRGQYRRIRAELPAVAIPEPGQRQRELFPARLGSSRYESVPGLERDHAFPPATGPPWLPGEPIRTGRFLRKPP